MSDHLKPCPCEPCPNVACVDGSVRDRYFDKIDCPTCNGTGRVQPPVTDEMVEAVTEVLVRMMPLPQHAVQRATLREMYVDAARAAINAYRAHGGTP